jgi:hypothetical protein
MRDRSNPWRLRASYNSDLLREVEREILSEIRKRGFELEWSDEARTFRTVPEPEDLFEQDKCRRLQWVELFHLVVDLDSLIHSLRLVRKYQDPGDWSETFYLVEQSLKLALRAGRFAGSDLLEKVQVKLEQMEERPVGRPKSAQETQQRIAEAYRRVRHELFGDGKVPHGGKGQIKERVQSEVACSDTVYYDAIGAAGLT